MEHIYFEQQEGNLCAQHALNNLLQSQLFSAEDLAEIANRLDQQERDVLDHASAARSSHNMDDTGYFSVQVISEALAVFGLQLVPLLSRSDEDALLAQVDPTTQSAYICNFREHWFTIRKIGHQWFNLNSLFKAPELVSDTFLSLLLTQLQGEGYSIFIIKGALPACEADEFLSADPVTADAARRFGAVRGATSGVADEAADFIDPNDDENQLARALALSQRSDPTLSSAMAFSRQEHDAADPTFQTVLQQSIAAREEEELERALALSLTDYDFKHVDVNSDINQPTSTTASSAATTITKPATATANAFSSASGKIIDSSSSTGDRPTGVALGGSKIADRPEALGGAPAIPGDSTTVDDLRRKRAAFLDRLQQQKAPHADAKVNGVAPSENSK